MNTTKFQSPKLSLFAGIYARLLRNFHVNQFFGQDSSSSVLILPAAATGSLGDEAMLEALIKYFSEQGITKIGVISYSKDNEWDHFNSVTETVNLSSLFKNNSWKSLIRFVSKVSSYKQFYCIGADVLDGFYSENRSLQRITLVALADQVGAKASIVSFSFNANPKPTVIEALANLSTDVRLCSRDPVSHKRLEDFLQRPIDLAADLAFLLQPTQNTDLVTGVSQWASNQRDAGRIIIGINANSLMGNDRVSFSSEELIKIYADALVHSFSKNPLLSFLMIPHDFRGKNSDVKMVEDLLVSLPDAMQSYCLKVPTPCSAGEVKAICAETDLVLTGRMHLAIAALGQEVPVACITYQGKFSGLLTGHFKLAGVSITPEMAFQPNQLANFLNDQISKRGETQKNIQAKLPDVKRLSSINLLPAELTT